MQNTKKKIKVRFTCSDYKHHEHRYKWTAWVCSRAQKWIRSIGQAKKDIFG